MPLTVGDKVVMGICAAMAIVGIGGVLWGLRPSSMK